MSVITTDTGVIQSLRAHADNPSAFLALNRETDAFTSPGVEGLIAYRRAGGHLVQLGGPFAPPGDYDVLLDRFLAYADDNDLRVVSVQLQRDDAERYASRGFTVNQIGASWAVSLDGFTLRGTKFMQLRNKISRAFRNGLTVTEVDPADLGEAIAEIDREWLGAKGEHVHQLEFLVGQLGGPAQEHRRLFLGRVEGRPVGYISYCPVYGTRPGWMHDLSRRIPGGSPGIMEAINSTAIEVFRGEGVPWLHFGFTPFTGLDASLELPGHNLGFQWLMHALFAQGADLYPAQTQLAYKQKWGPDLMIPEYIGFRGRASVAAFAHVFRACGAF
ncbi:bifunctional lysylphosphatidylglycerol flippase/synthetase MprF [Microbispora sp. NPDC049125]|uniref:bifunctional lysylphosphatidylglycerol flippase/synthetase MprF n=1 Tax=Microbispora sp. NPDC049125 TaxID=3154929 RepID=UPI003466A964